eukprot:m.195602 g.195602  ORF g.195602 m.195602 type:complete len:236 (-) comp18315_c0_seq2:40-747(-)
MEGAPSSNHHHDGHDHHPGGYHHHNNNDDPTLIMARAQLDCLAYSKVVMHACQHPYVTVNGILVGHVQHGVVHIVDALPLFHGQVALSCMLEAALFQVEQHCKAADLVMVGYYQAHEHVDVSGMDDVARKIAGKIRESCKHAVALIVNNDKISPQTLQKELAVQLFVGGHREDEWRVSADATGDASASLDLLPSAERSKQVSQKRDKPNQSLSVVHITSAVAVPLCLSQPGQCKR